MRMRLAAGGIALLFGCSRGPLPNQFSGPVPGPVPQAFACVTRQLDGLEYRVTTSDEARGLIRAERPDEQPWWLRIVGLNDSVDVVDASIQGTPPTLQATAYSVVIRAQQRQATRPSDEAREDARTIVSACGRL
jgi:hypothetical protein